MSARGASRRLIIAVAALASGLVGCGAEEAGIGPGTPLLHVSPARSSAPVAGASQLVLTIENRGDGDDRLVGADTEAAIAVEVHQTVVEEDGRAVMRLLEEVVIPAGADVHFRPGGLHLMVVVPDERVVVGGTFEVTLRFERSAPITVAVDVVDLLDLIESDGDDGG